MDKKSKEFLFSLLTTPSPTGFEQRIQRVVRDHVKTFAHQVTSDLHGNLIACLNPKASRRIMFAGHCDQIGFLVRHISNDGFVYVMAVGGIDTGVLPGAKIVIHNERGAVTGVFGRKAIHLQSEDERGKGKVDLEKVFIDIGAKNKKDAEKRIGVGDYATFAPEIIELGNNLICGPGLDDRVGLFVAMEALRMLSNSKLQVGIYAVSTVAEEIGLRGAHTSAFGIDPEIGIAIDVTHATDNPTYDKPFPISIKLGNGPTITRGPNVNPVVEKLLVAAAKKLKVPYQFEAYGRAFGNDANPIQLTRAGVAAGHLGIPQRYMHSQVEVCNLDDLDNAAKILAGFVKSITAKSDFRPVEAA